jgi:hypothetical protein
MWHSATIGICQELSLCGGSVVLFPCVFCFVLVVYSCKVLIVSFSCVLPFQFSSCFVSSCFVSVFV